MTKILAIGNSFSQDATAYLSDIARYGGKEIKVVNLYIGGCPLSLHWENVENNNTAYRYEVNGINTGKIVSMENTLLEDEWDIVTFQQASGNSGFINTYFPYLKNLSAYVKQLTPNAKQYMHQTWAYDAASTHPSFADYGNNQLTMYAALKEANDFAAAAINAGIIPCGQVMQALREKNIYGVLPKTPGLCRDGHHLEPTYGRFAAAATWFEILLDGNILNNSFLPIFPIVDEAVSVLRQTVHEICTEAKK